MVATSFLKRRQQVPKPRDRAPKFINRWSLRRGKCGGSIDETVKRRGVVGSAGVVERGKGTGWIAWKPGRSRSRPRASEPAVRVAGRTMTLAWKVLRPTGSANCETRSKEERVDLGSEANK